MFLTIYTLRVMRNNGDFGVLSATERRRRPYSVKTICAGSMFKTRPFPLVTTYFKLPTLKLCRKLFSIFTLTAHAEEG